jgi:transcriptional regulator with XRE-family HTH domain
MSEFLIDLGVRIKRAREDAHMEQIELAEALSTSRDSISHWEHGDRNVTVYTLAKIAQATNRPVWMLMPDLEDD